MHNLINFYFLLTLVSTSIESQNDGPILACPSGWTYLEESNQCYKIIVGKVFYETLDECARDQGSLASVHSEKENSILQEIWYWNLINILLPSSSLVSIQADKSLKRNDYETSKIKSKPRLVCPSGSAYYNQTDKCYEILYNMDFYQAEYQCKWRNGHLPSIHSVMENYFVHNLTYDGYPCPSYTYQYFCEYWIGLHNPYQDGVWRWTDGSDYDFKAWQDKSPTSGLCAVLYYNQGIISWYDEACSGPERRILCEITPLKK